MGYLYNLRKSRAYPAKWVNYTKTKTSTVAMLGQFPFRVVGLRSSNRLVESINGAVVGKHIGCGYIEPNHSKILNRFDHKRINSYLNFRRPCPQVIKTRRENGRISRQYEQYRTLREVLAAIERVDTYFPQGVFVNHLRSLTRSASDTECVSLLQEAMLALLDQSLTSGLSA